MRSYAHRLLGFLARRSVLFTVRRLDRLGLPFAGRLLVLAVGLRRYRLLAFLLWKILRFTVRRYGRLRAKAAEASRDGYVRARS
jgi:hypothetical protein